MKFGGLPRALILIRKNGSRDLSVNDLFKRETSSCSPNKSLARSFSSDFEIKVSEKLLTLFERDLKLICLWSILHCLVNSIF